MPVPVVTVSQMREWENATWATGVSPEEVIRRVGEAIAKRALFMTGHGDLVLVIVGKGNNGQDARAAAANLPDRRVEILQVTHPEADLVTLEQLLASTPRLIIDGLFGIGLDRPLDETWVRFIERVNAAKALVLSVDVPSGINADTGEVREGAIRADITVTAGAPKCGLLAPSALAYVGRLEVAADIGLPGVEGEPEASWTLPGDFAGYPPARHIASHKGSYGHLAILAGSLGYHGAAALAARAAQRAQPGLITLRTTEQVYHAVAPQLQAVMVTPFVPNADLPADYTAYLIGPGLAGQEAVEQMKPVTRRLWRDSTAPVIVDASALDWLALDVVPKNAVRVITPHPGEAARLLRSSPKQIEANRPEALRNISRRFGNCWVILKGHQTLIGRATGEIYVNSSGNPHMAQGGSGDVLAGYLAGLLAQPALQEDIPTALKFGVWQHGAAADELQVVRRNWVIEDLVEAIGGATISR
jgi:NAD(P)H-hydrate epimerase